MTKDEALRLALEALEDLGMKHHENTGEVLYKETFTAIKAALEAKDEPVATIDSIEQEIYENTRQFVSLDVMEWMLKRYYTTPSQQEAKDEPVACEECHLKDTVYDLLDDLKVANLKLSVWSQRTLVGLTDEEREQVINANTATGLWHMAKAIEAKLKEKNT